MPGWAHWQFMRFQKAAPAAEAARMRPHAPQLLGQQQPNAYQDILDWHQFQSRM